MSDTLMVVIVVAALIGVIALVRTLRNRDSMGYRRRFSEAPQRDDTAFPFVAMLYVGDGGAGSSHHHPAADCAHVTDAGGGCSDGGGGS